MKELEFDFNSDTSFDIDDPVLVNSFTGEPIIDIACSEEELFMLIQEDERNYCSDDDLFEIFSDLK